jgi:hypothetical protein
MTDDEFDKQNEEWLKNLKRPVSDSTQFKDVSVKIGKITRDGKVQVDFN